MPMGGSAGDGGAAAAERQRQQAINAGMASIDNAFSGFDNNFYNSIAKDYLSYATPQVFSQYQTTKNNLGYALARQGIGNSGAAVKENADLSKTLNRNLSTVSNQAENQANTVRSDVAAQKSNVTNELLSSANPIAAREEAQASVAGLQAPPAFEPISNMFGDFASTYLANKAATTYSDNQPSLLSLLGSLFSGNSGNPSVAMVQ